MEIGAVASGWSGSKAARSIGPCRGTIRPVADHWSIDLQRGAAARFCRDIDASPCRSLDKSRLSTRRFKNRSRVSRGILQTHEGPPLKIPGDDCPWFERQRRRAGGLSSRFSLAGRHLAFSVTTQVLLRSVGGELPLCPTRSFFRCDGILRTDRRSDSTQPNTVTSAITPHSELSFSGPYRGSSGYRVSGGLPVGRKPGLQIVRPPADPSRSASPPIRKRCATAAPISAWSLNQSGTVGSLANNIEAPCRQDGPI